MKCKWSDCFTCPYPDCINDYVPPTRKASPEQIKKNTQRMSLLRKERANNGLCTQCGKKPPREGYKMCKECQVKYARYKEKENRKKGVIPKSLLDGIYLCQKCGKYPPVEPYKLCEGCLESNRKHLDLTPTHNGRRVNSDFCNNHERFWHNG